MENCQLRVFLAVSGMSNREMVIELVSKLPENTPLEQIARKIELLAGINRGREEAKEFLRRKPES